MSVKIGAGYAMYLGTDMKRYMDDIHELVDEVNTYGADPDEAFWDYYYESFDHYYYSGLNSRFANIMYLCGMGILNRELGVSDFSSLPLVTQKNKEDALEAIVCHILKINGWQVSCIPISGLDGIFSLSNAAVARDKEDCINAIDDYLLENYAFSCRSLADAIYTAYDWGYIISDSTIVVIRNPEVASAVRNTNSEKLIEKLECLSNVNMYSLVDTPMDDFAFEGVLATDGIVYFGCTLISDCNGYYMDYTSFATSFNLAMLDKFIEVSKMCSCCNVDASLV